MMFNPRVSIIIPVYNGSNFLKEAIDSALGQTYENIEVIVVNDGSNDDGKTETVARSFGDKIRYLSKNNGGIATALNLGIREMKGAYFSWLSHDDVFYPNKIEMQINYLKNENNDIALYSDYDYIDDKSRYMYTEKIKHYKPDKVLFALLYFTPINGCTVLIPKLIFNEVGLFNEKLRTTQDQEMWFRIVKKFQFIHLPKALIKSRIHFEQGSWTIPTHLSEQHNLRRTFIDEIGIEELLYITDERSISSAYLKVALALKMHWNYTVAARYALDLCGKYLYKDNYVIRLKNIIIALYCRYYNRRLTIAYWMRSIEKLLHYYFLKIYLKYIIRKIRASIKKAIRRISTVGVI